jgi:membrane-bound acyltransferase YfiQ involved in biofilm formation
MAEGKHPSGGRTTYLFVDNVRFWSMAAIVAMHCLFFAWTGVPMSRALIGMVTILKFGTVGFFVISGFLLGDRVQTDTPAAYLSRRVKKVFVPWMFWFAVMVGIDLWLFHTHSGRQVGFGWSFQEIRVVGRQIGTTLFISSFWFVPNLLLGICVLLVFRRFLYRKQLGVVLLVVDLFYSVNIYGQWIESKHTEALLAFVFFLWLGSYASHRYAELQAWIETVRWGTLSGLAVLGVLMSFGEEMLLFHLHKPYPENTLRVSNQVMSILMLVGMAKAKHATWPSLIDVRRNTFGIYLTHWMILVGCWHIGAHVLPMMGTTCVQIGLRGRLVFGLVLFIATYGTSLWVTRALAGTRRLAWMVGAESNEGKTAPLRFRGGLENGHHVLGVGTDAVVGVGFGKEDAA